MNISAYLAADRRFSLASKGRLKKKRFGTVLFADLVRFTGLTELLLTQLGPHEGPEELTRILNQVYGALIDGVHRYQGAIISFNGDGISCWFDEDSGGRAYSCAIYQLKLMEQLDQSYEDISLTLKVGLATGTVNRFVVGNRKVQLFDMIAGDLLDQVGEAVNLALPNEIWGNEKLFTQFDLEFNGVETKNGRFLSLPIDLPLVEPTAWENIPLISEEEGKLWLLPSVYQRLEGQSDQFLADLRSVAVLFLGFTGIDYDFDSNAADKLDRFVNWVQEQVGRFEGAVMQVMSGDKGSHLYISFGAPISHNDDPHRALMVAKLLQSLPAEFEYIENIRIGIAYGAMRAGAYGSDKRQSYGVIGDKVNLAARLMDLASPGEILCDDVIYLATEKEWQFDHLPATRVKGRLTLVRAHRLGNLSDKEIEGEESDEEGGLIGRAEDLAQLEFAVKELADGNAQLLMIEGEAGIGKSRIVAELPFMLRRYGLTGLIGSGWSMEQQTPYRAWRDLFTSYFGLEQLQDDFEKRKRVAEVISTALPQSGHRLSLFNDLLNIKFPETIRTRNLDPVMRHKHLSHMLLSLLKVWADEKPLLIVLEDVHWLDTLSWELVVELGRMMGDGNLPLTLILVTRPLEAHSVAAESIAKLKMSFPVKLLSLSTLSPEETVALVAQRLEVLIELLPQPLIDLIQDRAEGHPFFAEELIYSLRDDGVLILSGEGAERRCLLDGDVATIFKKMPHTVQELILARIDRLLPKHQLTLKVASVIGRTFSYVDLWQLLQNYASVGDEELKQHLLDLAVLDLTPLETVEPELVYIFKHIITQEVAYGTLLFSQRRELHRSVADLYEQQLLLQDERVVKVQGNQIYPLLVYHYHQARALEKELQYAQLAGAQAARQYANSEALGYFSRALELLPEEEEEIAYQLRLKRERIYDLEGDREEQAEELKRLSALLATLNQPQLAAELHLRETNYGIVTGDYTTAVKQVQQAIKEATLGDNKQQQAAGYMYWGSALWNQSNYGAAREKLHQAIQLSEQFDFPAIEATCWRNLGAIAYYQGIHEESLQFSQKAFNRFMELDDLRGASRALNGLGAATSSIGDYVGSIDYFQQSLRVAEQIGDRRGASIPLVNLGIVYDQIGAYQESELALTRFLQIKRQIQDRSGEVWGLNSLALLYHHLGQNRKAEKYARQGVALAREVGDRNTEGNGLCWLGHILSALKKDEAVEIYEQSLVLRAELGQPILALEVKAGLLRYYLKRDQTKIELLLEEMLPYLEEGLPVGAEEPFRIFGSCYHALLIVDEIRATQLKEKIDRLVVQQSDRIKDKRLRTLFLAKIEWELSIV